MTVRAYVIDKREKKQAVKVPTTEVYRFLTGQSVKPTPKLLKQIKAEFDAHERYRATLVDQLQKAIGALSSAMATAAASHEAPYRTASEAYWRGYDVGRYSATARAHTLIADALHVAASTVEGIDAPK